MEKVLFWEDPSMNGRKPKDIAPLIFLKLQSGKNA
jgi:hypothetical protein